MHGGSVNITLTVPLRNPSKDFAVILDSLYFGKMINERIPELIVEVGFCIGQMLKLGRSHRLEIYRLLITFHRLS